MLAPIWHQGHRKLSDLFEVARPNGTTYGRAIVCRREHGGCDRCITHRQQSTGYTQLMIDGSMKLLHRYRFETECGPIPDGHHLHHVCEHPWCVNPHHLQIVTHAEHMRITFENLKARGWKKARTKPPKPPKTPQAPKKRGRKPKAVLDQLAEIALAPEGEATVILTPVDLVDVLSADSRLNQTHKVQGIIVTVRTPLGGKYVYRASDVEPLAPWVPGAKNSNLSPLYPQYSTN